MVPKMQTTMLPLLRLLAKNGEMRSRDIVNVLADQFDLSGKDRLEMLPSGNAPHFYNNIGWALTHLKRAGLIELIKRATYRISELGLDVLKENPSKVDIKYLNRFPQYTEPRSTVVYSGQGTEGDGLATIKIHTARLGTTVEVRSLLTDIENAYKGIYTFQYIVELLDRDNADYEETSKRIDNMHRRGEFNLESESDDDRVYDVNSKHRRTLNKFLELSTSIDFERIVMPSERLRVSKVNIQSPGFWEFLGKLNPLEVLREFINDHHGRKKDHDYRNDQERRKGELEIEKSKIDIEKSKVELKDMQLSIIERQSNILKGMGLSDTEIRSMAEPLISIPFEQLGRQINAGMIDGPGKIKKLKDGKGSV